MSTYLNLLDVHVTRAPCDATVVLQTYRRGRHRRASSPTAHVNERLEWRLSTEHGEMVLTQYAGAVARRIVAYRSIGDVLRHGERIGLIRFGSRVDVTLPAGLPVTVRAGNGCAAERRSWHDGIPRERLGGAEAGCRRRADPRQRAVRHGRDAGGHRARPVPVADPDRPVPRGRVVVVAGTFLDVVDGAAARRWGGTPLGPPLDCLADAITFGVAPVVARLVVP